MSWKIMSNVNSIGETFVSWLLFQKCAIRKLDMTVLSAVHLMLLRNFLLHWHIFSRTVLILQLNYTMAYIR